MTTIQKTDLLLASYITAIVASELMGSKVFSFSIINASVAIFTYPFTFMINDVVAEVYGKERAMSFVRSGWMILLGLFIFSLLAVNLPAATRFTVDSEYAVIFGKSQRMILASLTAFWLSERFDVLVFTKIREKLGKDNLWLRNNASNFVGQLFDTTVFMFLAFYQPGHFWFILSLIWPYWSVKCLASLCETPLTYLGVRWLRVNQD